MKHGGHLRRGLFLAAALALAGQARALGASSGQGNGSTGGPQAVYDQHVAPPGSPVSMSERGATGVPTWYSVDTTRRPPPAHAPVMVFERHDGVPSWYAIG